MTGTRSRQKGLGIFSTLVTILVGGFALMVAVKLVPLYLDNYAVSRVLTSLNDKPAIASAGTAEVHDWLKKGLQTNLVELDPKEIRVFQDQYDVVGIEIDYERRLKLVSNVDLIVSFEHDWKVKSQ